MNKIVSYLYTGLFLYIKKEKNSWKKTNFMI